MVYQQNKEGEEKRQWPFWEQKRSHPLDWCSSNEILKVTEKSCALRKMDTESTSDKPLQASVLQAMFENYDILSAEKWQAWPSFRFCNWFLSLSVSIIHGSNYKTKN